MKAYGEIFCIDLDGTLTQDSCWTPEQVLHARPVQAMVDKVNELAQFHFIVIYTARRDALIEATLAWLRKIGLRYHAISNLKIPTSYYVDDKNLSIEQFLDLKLEGTPTTKMR